LNNVNQAGKAVGNFVGGLFHKKKTDDSQTPADSTTDAPASTAAATLPTPDPFAQLTLLGSYTVETVSINADAIPSDRFEVPAGWTKEVPKAIKAANDDFTCPKTGG
jgi:hypothetical protein